MDKRKLRRYLSMYGNEMKRARKNKNMAQWEVAMDTGINQSIICNIEQGFYFPSEYMERKLIKEYGIEEIGV